MMNVSFASASEKNTARITVNRPFSSISTKNKNEKIDVRDLQVGDIADIKGKHSPKYKHILVVGKKGDELNYYELGKDKHTAYLNRISFPDCKKTGELSITV